MYAETVLRHCERQSRKPRNAEVSIIKQKVRHIRECYAPEDRYMADNLEQRLAKLLSLSK